MIVLKFDIYVKHTFVNLCLVFERKWMIIEKNNLIIIFLETNVYILSNTTLALALADMPLQLNVNILRIRREICKKELLFAHFYFKFRLCEAR